MASTTSTGSPRRGFPCSSRRSKRKFKLTKQSPKIDSGLQGRRDSDLHPRKATEGQEGAADRSDDAGLDLQLRIGVCRPATTSGSRAATTGHAARRKPPTQSRTRRRARSGSTAASFKGERLLYWAYFVPSGGKKNNEPTPGAASAAGAGVVLTELIEAALGGVRVALRVVALRVGLGRVGLDAAASGGRLGRRRRRRGGRLGRRGRRRRGRGRLRRASKWSSGWSWSAP